MVWLLVGIMVLMFFVLLRAILGPTVIDRLLAINAITSKVSAIILLLGFLREDFGYVDVALVFVLCSFVGGIWILRVLVPGDWEFRLPRFDGFAETKEEVASND